jgi:hypothetical protein
MAIWKRRPPEERTVDIVSVRAKFESLQQLIQQAKDDPASLAAIQTQPPPWQSKPVLASVAPTRASEPKTPLDPEPKVPILENPPLEMRNTEETFH